MAVLQADFAPPKASFDYPSFQAEYKRRKRMTRYQRATENAEVEKARKQAALPAPTPEGIPFWADYQMAPGIMNTAHRWQQDRYEDPDTGMIRYSPGALDEVRNIYSGVEPDAIRCIESAALTWTVARGRTTVTPSEHRVHSLSKRYMVECDRHEFRAKNQGFEPRYRTDGSLVEKIMYSWISRLTGFAVSYVEELLIAVDNVYMQRAILGLESAPEVRIAATSTRKDASAGQVEIAA